MSKFEAGRTILVQHAAIQELVEKEEPEIVNPRISKAKGCTSIGKNPCIFETLKIGCLRTTSKGKTLKEKSNPKPLHVITTDG
jgi:hypothetical protein